VTVFGCLGGALMIAMLSLCSSFTVLSYILSYKSVAAPRSSRPKHGLRFPEQPEAGVTPEARRDRAAILRRGGVAPAHPSVLAASSFLPRPLASGHFSIGLSTPAAKADPNDPPNVPSWLLFTSTAVLGVGFRFGVGSNKPVCPSTSSLSKITLRGGDRS
jgi:hypothetical protein